MIINPYIFGGVSIDTDAQLFITNAVITDATQQNAIITLVLDLKTANVWSKFRAIYPFVGGTSAKHRYNLKAPQSNDASFYIDFAGGVSHSVNGVQFDGASGYANTKINANSTNFVYTSMHAFLYSKTNSDGAYYDAGVQTNNGYRFLEFDIREGNTFYGAEIHLGSSYLTYTNTNSIGRYLLNRPNATTINLFKNGTKVQTATQLADFTIFGNIPIWIGALNRTYAAPTGYTNRQFAFASFGDGFSDSEALAVDTAINTFNTTLGR
jgi:hypothetical protein